MLPSSSSADSLLGDRSILNPSANLLSATPSALESTLQWLAQSNLSFSSFGPQVTPETLLPVDPNWQLVATADFSGDGSPDLFWRNRVTGENVIWEMGFSSSNQLVLNPTITLSSIYNPLPISNPLPIQIPSPIGPFPTLPTSNQPVIESFIHLAPVFQTWDVVAAADFNRDGSTDLFWRNRVTGENVVWEMGFSSSHQPVIESLLNLCPVFQAWDVAATADFNGDGSTDLFWRNRVTGENVVWEMGFNSTTKQAGIDALLDLFPVFQTWDVAKAADFTGDGKADLFWRNHVTGENVIWEMGFQLPTTGFFPWDFGSSSQPAQLIVRSLIHLDSLASEWDVAEIADLTSSMGVFWRNQMTGENTIWFGTHPAAINHLFPILVGDPPLLIPSPITYFPVEPGIRTGFTIQSVIDLLPVFTDWNLSAIADFTGEGIPDLFWHNDVTGENVVWKIDLQFPGQGVFF